MRMTNCISLATSDMLMTGLHFELQGPEAGSGGNNFNYLGLMFVGGRVYQKKGKQLLTCY